MMNDYPPSGAYAVDDPYLPGSTSYWAVKENGLEAWPLGSGGKYGPLRPAKGAPRDEVKFWRGQLEEYRLEVLKRIAADPAEAAARFTAATDRCARCRRFHHAEELPDSAAAGRGRVADELADERRDVMAVDLRRAGHPEALIAQALHMNQKRINRLARQAGIGAPLRPGGRAAAAAGQSVTVITHRDNAGHENAGGDGPPVTTVRDNASRDNAGALDAAETAPAATNRGYTGQGNTADLEASERAGRGPMSREQAETVVRDALLSAVALATRDIEQVDVPVGELLQGNDTEAVVMLQARLLGAVLGVVLPGDNGRRLLAQIAATAVNGEE